MIRVPEESSDSELRKVNNPGLKRVTADFSPEAYSTLSEVAELLGSSKVDALRRSLGLMHFVLIQQKEKWKVVLEKDGRRKEVVAL